jgi:formate dehydrogenase alpha subunit
MELIKVRIKINGHEVSVPQNYTILEACKSNNIFVPTLCYLKDICDEGTCGVCVVEVTKAKTMQRACITQVFEGMEINTDSKTIDLVRKTNVELMLANHPLDCMVCDKDGDCELQDLAYQYGIKKSKFLADTAILDQTKSNSWSTNPFIQFNPNKCILCRRCVSACANQAVTIAIAVANRGIDSVVSTGFKLPLEETNCQFCAECVQACPTGALLEKSRIGKGKLKDLTPTNTTCAYCGVGCQLTIYKDKNENLVMAKGTVENSLNKGRTCVKGRYGHEYTQSPERLTTPLIKKNGKFEEATWEEALNYTAKKLTEIKNKYGSDSIAVLGSSRCTNEDNYVIQKFARAVIGTNNVDNCARLCHSSTVAGLAKSLGAGAATNSFDDFPASDVYFIIGSNMTETHPVFAQMVKENRKKNGTKLIVCDPRYTDIAKESDIYIPHNPGTDVALLNGIMKIIIDEKLANDEFVVSHTEGYEEFKKVVEAYDVDKVAEITGVKKELILEAARTYGKAKSAMIFYTMGITQHSTGVDNVMSIANLVLLTGNIGKPGAGIMAQRGQANVQGACDMGCLPNVYPAYQSVTDPAIQEKFEKAWNVKLSNKLGKPSSEYGEMGFEGTLKGIYLMGENPLMSDADIIRIREGFDKMEFIVTQNIFMCDTVEIADVVFPSFAAYEKYGTFANTERRVQLLRQTRKPMDTVRDDWEIVCQLAKAMGHDLGFNTIQDVNDEIMKLTPSYGGISFERLEKGSLQWPCPDLNSPGTKILHKDGVTKRPGGKGLLAPIEYKQAKELTDKDYPIVLTTGRILYHYHTGNESRHVRVLDAFVPKNYVEVNPMDAEKWGIKDKELVRVTTRRGSLDLNVRISDKPKSGIVFIPFHFCEAPANILTNAALDPVCKIPEFKVAACKIEKINQS